MIDKDNFTYRKIDFVYRRLLAQYGSQNWWPGETWFEIVTGAVLAQGTSWGNVEKAIKQLKLADAMTPRAVREMQPKLLAELIYSSGYYRTKADRLKALAEYLHQRFEDNIEAMRSMNSIQLRKELLEINGIGEETADDILLYAVGSPVFVIDSYTRRMFFRLGIAPDAANYGVYQSIFMSNLEPDVDLMKEYHALIVRHGSKVCRPKPLCMECCIQQQCEFGLKLKSISG